jgi:rhodanese-related sulfurtransferase
VLANRSAALRQGNIMSDRSTAGYAGDVSASEAYTILQNDNSSVLVDVRTKAEWNYVGVPDLSSISKRTLLIEWQEFPSMNLNPNFTATLEKAFRESGVARDAPALFLCRSGARSRAAAIALTEAGHTRCFNIADGFEGPLDDKRHRGAIGGWKAQGLPWSQS